MELKSYIKFRGMTQDQAAKEIGIARTFLNAILRNKKKPGIKAVRAIIKWSNGDVRFEDLI